MTAMISPRSLAVVIAVSIAALFAAASASAATFTVTTTADKGDGTCDATCSLRDAVSAANLDATKDTIVLAAGTYRLERFGLDETNENGDLDVSRPLVIQGSGAGTTTITASGLDRVIDVLGTNLSLSGVTVTGGIASGEGGLKNNGGGIRATGGGTLELDGVVVRGNVAQGEASPAAGGGIYKQGGSLIVRNSAIVGNIARSTGFGGGIAIEDEDTVTSLTNVTIAQNTASIASGGIHFNEEAKAEFAYTTVIENEAVDEGGAMDGNGNLQLRSSIVARNSAPKNPDCSLENGPASLGGNVGSASCGFTLASDFVTADPMLAPLGGAAVPVAEPLLGSPALDRGLAPCPATDARGVARPQGGACDSGAAERQVSSAASTAGPQAPSGKAVSQPAALKISALSVSQTKFRAGAKVVARASKGKPPVGTTISFRLSGAGGVKGTVERLVKGRKAGGKCLPATPVRKGKPNCTRLVAVGSLPIRAYPAGPSSIDFSGRLGGKDLAPGRYEVELSVASSGSTATTPPLRILP